MATANQTARNKFLELRKSGVDAVTARKQAYGEVTPAQAGGVVQANPTASVEGQPPAVAPTQPTPESFNAQTQGMNVAERQAVRQGQTPATTPVTPPAQPTPVPVTPAPEVTTEIKEPVKAPVDKTAEIEAQTNAKLTENAQKAQLEETKRQTIAQETAKTNVPTSQQDIFNQLVSGVGVAPQKTSAYRAAQFQYTKYNRLNAMTPSQLQSSIKNGDISSEMDRLLASNPNYVQAKQKYEEEKKVETLNNSMKMLNSSMTGAKVEQKDGMQELADKILKSLNITDKTYEDAFATYVSNNPKVVEYTEQLSGINRDIAETTQRINDGYKAFKAEKSDMPASAYILYAQTMMSEATDYLNSLNNTKTYLEADLKNAIEMGKAQYDAVSKDISQSLAQRNAVISQVIQSQFSLATKQAEMDMETANAQKIAELALNDPATAISNVMATYAEMGIPFTESIQTKVANAEEFIAQGGTLGGYIDKMIKDIQNKPEYKAMARYQMSQYAPATTTKTPEWKQDASGNWYDANSMTSPQFQTIDRQSAISKYGSTPAVRNFNPGNIMDTGFGGQKVAGERFTVFNSPQEGFNALVAKIQNIQAGGSKVYSPEMTLVQYMSKYAPASDNNNPTAYAESVARDLGVTSSTKIKDLDPVKLAMAHAKHEDGNSYRMLQDLGIGTGTQATGYNTQSQIFDALFNFSGGASKVSEGEMKLMQDRAKTFSEMGLTPQQAIIKYKGFNINDSVNPETATAYINIGDNLSKKPNGYESTVSKYLNSGDTEGLSNYVNRLVDADVSALYKSDAILSADYNTGLSRTNQLISLIQNNADKIGAFDGRVNNLIQKFSGTPEYQTIKTLLQMSQADMRKYFAGSAVTETEMKALEDFIGGTTKMNSDNLVTMLQTLMNDRTMTYSNQRQGLIIPGVQQQKNTQNANLTGESLLQKWKSRNKK